MADKIDKPRKQKAKAKQEQQGVLGALPATRPDRIGRRRARPATPTTFEPTTAGATPETSKPAARKKAKMQVDKVDSKPAADAAPTLAAKAAPDTAAKARAKPAASATAKPAVEAANGPAAKPTAKPTAESAAPATAKPAAKAKPKGTASRRKAAAPRTFTPTEAAEAAAAAQPVTERPPAYPRPRAVSEGAPELGTPWYRDLPGEDDGRPAGVGLAASAVRAAGEVAQLGLAIGGDALKSVAKRLPRP